MFLYVNVLKPLKNPPQAAPPDPEGSPAEKIARQKIVF